MLNHNTDELTETGTNMLTVMGMLLAWTIDHIGALMAIMVALSAIAVNMAKFLKITFESGEDGKSLFDLFKAWLKSKKQ